MKWLGGRIGFVIAGLIGIASVLMLIALALSWTPEVPWLVPPLSDFVVSTEHQMSKSHSVQLLTNQWDWERLRLGATIWIFLEGFGFLASGKLPIPLVGSIASFLLLGLVVLQYAAVGGGQPVWAIEHLTVHLLETVGFMPPDILALRQFVHERFAARSYHPISPQSQVALAIIAFGLAFGTHLVLEWLTPE